MFASCCGECFQYAPDEHHHITVTSPVYLQGDHAEADTQIVFHVANITADNAVVRCLSNTDRYPWTATARSPDHDQHRYGLWDGKQLEVHQLDQHC